MNDYGEIEIVFRQDIMLPKSIDQKFWDNLFRISITSLSDDEITSVKFDKTVYRRLLNSSGEIKFEPKNKFSFNPSISSFTESGIKIKLNFEHLKELGLSGLATYELEILEPSILKTKSMMQSVTSDSVFGG